MEQRKRTAASKSESEEATWWASQQDALLEKFEQAAREGTLGRGTLAKQTRTPTTTIRLNVDDVALAKEQAAERGLRYQTYLKMLLHQSLVREAERVSRKQKKAKVREGSSL